MMIHILYAFKESPWGGGNQFLNALRGELRQQHAYTDTIQEADAMLVNVNPSMFFRLAGILPLIRYRYPQIPIIMRVDGPIALVRGVDRGQDRFIASLINSYADSVVFQSQWSKTENERIGIKPPHSKVIYNAVDPVIFYPSNKRNKKNNKRKIRLISTSWSSNERKGFQMYKWIDEHLDFTRYTFTFIGNSPVSFKNIKVIKPLSSIDLAEQLRAHDVYVTASMNDPCSNALIEAIACGLPAVARNSGGHPEIVGNGGELFTSDDELEPTIEKVSDDIDEYKSYIRCTSIKEVAKQYIEVIQFARSHIRDNPKPSFANMLAMLSCLARIYLKTH